MVKAKVMVVINGKAKESGTDQKSEGQSSSCCGT